MASKVSVVLRPVKSILVRFCPFEPNVESTRKFLQTDGDRLIMKGAHLTTGEMLTALASRCNAKDLKEEQKSKKKNP